MRVHLRVIRVRITLDSQTIHTAALYQQSTFTFLLFNNKDVYSLATGDSKIAISELKLKVPTS